MSFNKNENQEKIKFSEIVKSFKEDVSLLINNVSLEKLKHIWGMLFRTIFICSVGYFGYLFINPEPIWDTPFSELTLNKLTKAIFGALIIIGCLKWFFNLPDRPKDAPSHFSPYKRWADFSGFLFVIAVLIWAFINN
jgi:hypothetical protein